MRARLIDPDNVKTVKLVADAHERINVNKIDDYTISRTRTAKAIIDTLVGDCIQTSQKAIENANIKTLEDVYAHSGNLIVLSRANKADLAELEEFLMQNFYLHAEVRRTSDQVREWLSVLFEQLHSEPESMPAYFRNFIHRHGLERTVCDYIAGMTDRFCLKLLDK
ncbi:MAG: hypothetical protein ACYS8Z_27195 [Planctomycetota bacterium]|jgi:dGTPase